MKKETIEMFHLVIATALQLKKAAGMLADGAVPEPATPKARPPCGQFGPPTPRPRKSVDSSCNGVRKTEGSGPRFELISF